MSVIKPAFTPCRLAAAALWAAAMAGSLPAFGAGTQAGTDITNTAEVAYQVGATSVTETSNLVTITVAEIVDVDVTLQSPQTPVTAGSSGQDLLFTVTNTGNGTETFTLAIDSALAGDNFDPVPTLPNSIYFDTDGSGDLSAADTPYTPGSNDPNLAPDASVDIIIVNDIPGAVSNGDLGQSALIATSATGTGPAGTVFAGAGDGGVDAVSGTSEGDDQAAGEYIIQSITVTAVKSATVSDPFGGTEPVPGAEITYQVDVTANGSGTATAAAFSDAIPANTTYVPGSIELNGAPLTDVADADAGAFDGVGLSVSVALGDLTAASGTQVVVFRVVID